MSRDAVRLASVMRVAWSRSSVTYASGVVLFVASWLLLLLLLLVVVVCVP